MEMSNETLKPEKAVYHIKEFIRRTNEDEHGRYLSWIHCFNVFKENRFSANMQTYDYLALHLAFYLASWGMYRGSSFLLQKDYKIHVPVVKMLLERKYHCLYAITPDELIKEKNLDLLMELSHRIKSYYENETPSFTSRKNNATDTLITKILMGTLGFVPAYDRYYRNAVKKYHVSTGYFNSNSIKQLCQFYIKYFDEFETCRKEISTIHIEYPPMKLMDMCFWQIGLNEE